MAIQSEVFSTAFNVRTFASTKYIATKQHMSIWLKRVSDETWTQLSVNEFELINNSAVLIDVPSSSIYSMIEIRVADEPNELGSSQSDITIVASLESQIQEIIDTVIPNINEILLADDNATTATTKALEALTSANNADTSEANALTYSNNALTSANNADTSEANALSYKNSAEASATTATTQAGIATTKATEALGSATLALGYKNEAEVFRDDAEGFASSIDPSNLVHKTSDETIPGIKTFSSSPIVPTPTNGDNTTKVATTAFVNAEISGDVGVANSSLVKTALNATGTAPIYACRAWVNFNGTGTVAIRESGNVSSITDNGVGSCAVNFVTSMVDANFSTNVTADVGTINDAPIAFTRDNITPRTTSQVTVGVTNSLGTAADSNIITVSVFR